MEDKCGIYKVTNQINNKSYIGKSKHIYLRWKQHHTEPFNKNANAYNTLFYRAIRKYGIDQFKFEIIEECLEKELNERERYWIKQYNTFILSTNSQGYNMTEGGEKTSFQLQYDIDLIEKLWNEGKTYSEIRQITNYNSNILTRYLDYLQIDINERRRRANLYKEKIVYKYSLNGDYIQSYPSVSQAVRSLLSEYPKANTSNICYACSGKIQQAYGCIWSYKKYDKINKKVKHSKINQYDLTGKFIKTYNTQTEAIRDTNIKNVSSITNACTGKAKTAGGYIWRYYDASMENPIANLTNI